MASRKSHTARRTSSRPRAARSRARKRRGARLALPALPGLGWPPRLPELDQRQRDLLGLAAIAAGVYLGFVLYGDWDGGRVGAGLGEALGWLVGRAKALAPVALVAGGVTLLARPVWPNLRPLRAGALCLAAGITMALAAGTLGVSPSASPRSGESSWSSVFMQSHGGAVGESLYQLSHRLVQSVGVDVLILFLLTVGATLLTGVSPARALRGVLAALGQLVASCGQTLDRAFGIGAHAERRRSPQITRTVPAALEDERLLVSPPDPSPEELIVRATHVEAPSQDGRRRNPDESRDTASPPADQHEGQERVLSAAGASETTEPPGAEEEISGVAHADPHELTPQGRYRESHTQDPDFCWELPDAGKLLTRSTGEQAKPDTAGQERTAQRLIEALGHFGVQAQVIGTVAGPHITRYELRLAPGTKVAKVAQLKDDLAYALAATEIRILAPIPGKQAVGVEVPNQRRRIVRLGDVFQAPPRDWSPLTVWLGKDVAGKAIGADLAKMPHLLVAGTTGAGKSGAINAMLCSVLLRATPHELRLVLVDPKQVELNHYESIPHLLTPVITSPRMAANALQNLVREMEQRYGTMSLSRTRSLVELNKARRRRGEAPLPYILCVIDELADLMMVAPADVEDSIIRLAQKARAVGIHLVLATQSPRVDVITGMIKANVPSRIAFAVSSQTDSRVILDQNGAESLLGQGDMLFSPVGSSRLQRIQGAYIDEEQIAKLTELWRRQGEPELHEELLEEVEPSGSGEEGGDELDPDEDPLLREAIVLVAEMGTASTSMLQRRLRLGYTRAGRLIDMLERRGVISGYEGSKPRQVLVSEADLPRVLASLGEPTVSASD
jgi:DNA segregation ATPase FtsK/SpoIIIE, S-DNA-T family